jgi:hypothetical protein
MMATADSAPLVFPFDVTDLPIEARRDYLRKLWVADVDPVVFMGVAKKLGICVFGREDHEGNTPTFVPTTRVVS